MALDWVWVDVEVAITTHDVQLVEHGGAAGIRDKAMLESAMARPLNMVAYGDPDAAALLASYAFGIARNHRLWTATNGRPRSSAKVFCG